MAYTQNKPLPDRPPKRKPYERPRRGKITPIIIFRDPNEPPKRRHQHTSGKARRDKSKPIFCQVCGEQIPEIEIKTQRKNRKFHKACNPNNHKSKSGKSVCPLGNIKGAAFIELFDKEFNLKPNEIEVN